MHIVLKTLIRNIPKVSAGAIGCFMGVGLESVQIGLGGSSVDVAKALFHPELELPSIPCKPTVTIAGSPKTLYWTEFGDLWRVLLLVAHT